MTVPKANTLPGTVRAYAEGMASHKGNVMSRLTSTAVIALCLALGACASNTRSENAAIGAVTGAVVGGVAGSALTGGSTVGTVVGAGAGAAAGHEIGRRR